MDLEEMSTQISVDNSQIDSLSKLCEELQAVQINVTELEDKIKEKKEEERKLSEERIPNMMHEMGVSLIKLNNGAAVQIKPFYAAKIPTDRVDEAFQWLRDNGQGDLIKNNITLTFGKSQDEQAKNLVDELRNKGHNVSQVEKVEPMTLKAFVKEQIEKGAKIPSDLFGVYTANKTKITNKE